MTTNHTPTPHKISHDDAVNALYETMTEHRALTARVAELEAALDTMGGAFDGSGRLTFEAADRIRRAALAKGQA